MNVFYVGTMQSAHLCGEKSVHSDKCTYALGLAILIIWQSWEVGPCPTGKMRVLQIWSILCSERCVFPQISPEITSGDYWSALNNHDLLLEAL